MAFTEFACRSGGSNNNGGAIASNGEPATSPVYTATNGGWNSATGVFTPTSGNPSLTVTVGDFASVFTDGSPTDAVFIARVTAVSSTTITLSTTAKSGTAPGTAGTGISINVGGAWKGPNGADIFPFGFVAAAMINAAGNTLRVNFKNDQTYSVSASCTANTAGAITYQGYTTTYGDLGKFTLDASTNAIVILNMSAAVNSLLDAIISNNGSSGSNAGITVSGARSALSRVVAHDVRGFGFNITATDTNVTECEAYLCNGSTTAVTGGFGGGNLIRCISHDNSAANSSGFISPRTAVDCISDSNASHGFTLSTANTNYQLKNCDSYSNGGSGISWTGGGGSGYFENCNLVKNAAFGITVTGTNNLPYVLNCAYGAGTQANGSGATNYVAAASPQESGAVTLANDVTPWVDPANGDFRISLSAVKGAGRGAFTETQASYAGTVGFPDIGAAQHQDASSGHVASRQILGM